jgi:class 3 adenylate cyclase
MSLEQKQLEAGIDALERQRPLLGDAVVDAALAGLRAKLAALRGAEAAPPAQALRQVSILFLDVVGSTAPARAARDRIAFPERVVDRCQPAGRHAAGD